MDRNNNHCWERARAAERVKMKEEERNNTRQTDDKDSRAGQIIVHKVADKRHDSTWLN